MVGGKFHVETGHAGIGAAEHASMKADAGVVEDFALIVDDRAAEEIVTHQVDERVEQIRVRRSHDNAEGLFATHEPR